MESVLITGANSGLGFEVAKLFAKNGFYVMALCRTRQKALETQKKIQQQYPNSQILPLEADLSSIKQIRTCLEQLDVPVHYLICNAGIAYTDKPQQSEDGFELIFSINHLAHYVFSVALQQRYPNQLKSIVVVSSDVHNPDKTKGQFPEPKFSEVRDFAMPPNTFKKWKTEANRRYVHSKLCNVLFTYGMAQRLKEQNATTKINAFNPGFMIGTNLGRNQPFFTRFMLKNVLPLMKPFIKEMRTVEESAKDLMNICLQPSGSGLYFDGQKSSKSSELSYHPELINDLWSLSEELSGFKWSSGLS